jgi:hypothetical protein
VEVDKEINGVEDDENEIALGEKGQYRCLLIGCWFLVAGSWLLVSKVEGIQE